ncbi:MAG: hypothetical protein KDA83_06595 [Planctomycetales bacterium]|nr:hypothetical protein [Planctomycetales bacterium]
MKVGKWALIALGIFGGIAILAAWIVYRVLFGDHPGALFETIEKTDVKQPPINEAVQLVDDRLEDRMPTFDPDLIDSRPIGDWQVNISAAILRIDVPMIRPDREPYLVRLRPSYAAALSEDPRRRVILPSANLIDGVGKQFDDGLYAALELAMFRGDAGQTPAVMDVVNRLHAVVPAESEARAYLEAVLLLSGASVESTSAVEGWRRKLEAQPMSSPAGFYTWNEELKSVWRTFRALQYKFASEEDEPVVRQLAEVLAADETLANDYRAMFDFYNHLSNPSRALSLVEIAGDDRPLSEIAGDSGRQGAVTCLPVSTSRETELFSQLFPLGLPAGADLMTELIKRIRSGDVDLSPHDDEGWYQHQVYALETLLLTDGNQESSKLVLTAAYKRRLLEAFKALVTKRRETHMRSLDVATAESAALMEGEVHPRLRLEPTASFYLRTARAYDFIQTLLVATIGNEKLSELHGVTADGERTLSLGEELETLKLRYYGFYLVTCEDIGMRPEFAADEMIDTDAAMAAALEWLDGFAVDPDLAVDTRVCVPIYIDPLKNETRYWGTIGIRLVKLDARYLTPPSVRPLDENGQPTGEWQEAERYLLSESEYLIAVDEFAEFTMPGVQVLTREAFRELCTQVQTKEDFLLKHGG